MSTVALSLAGVAVAMILLGPLLAHFSVVPPLTGFTFWVASVLPGLGAIVAGALALLLKRGPSMTNAAAIALGLIPLLVVGSIVKTGKAVPRINDITTDLVDPPSFVQAKTIPANEGRSLDYPEKFKAKVRAGYPDLGPATRDGSAAQVLERAVAAAKELGWEVTAVETGMMMDSEGSGAAGRFEAVSASKLWNFRDDIVVRVREVNGKVRVDVRSKSRDGKGDFGANAARIRSFVSKL